MQPDDQVRDQLARAQGPCLALDQDSRVTGWNRPAVHLLGHQRDQVLGATLGGILAPRDVFGNRWCAAACSLHIMVREGEPIEPFELDLRKKAGDYLRVRVRVTTLVRSPGSGYSLLLHFEPVRRRRRSDRRSGAYSLSSLRGDSGPNQRPRPTSSFELTRREVEVMRILVKGKSSRQIAEELNISPATVRNHIQRILKKLDVGSRAAAVAIALRNRLI